MTQVDDALAALRDGRLVVMPTDTVYGVAALLSLEEAVAALFVAKGRPESKAIPVLVGSLEDLEAIAELDERARRVGTALWPGPLTLVLRRRAGFEVDLGGTENETIAVRIPDHPIALELLDRSGPLAVTSANRSGEPPATTPAAARAALGQSVAVYLDGGTCVGTPST
ncbi:MAG: L-threonylcarbamoyladenylate synthase, partial [Actinomycetota bacterium]